MDKQAIIRNFSKHAGTYDRYCDAQNLAASKLAAGLSSIKPGKILEIGCGTGNYTLLLRRKFKSAQITALDISKEMLEAARHKIGGNHIDFLLGDAEKCDFSAKFDLITSNACFQWFEDLGAALIKYKQKMRRGGMILFSIFGPETFRELNAPVSAHNFIAEGKIKKIMVENFRKARIEEFIFRQSFARLKDLLEKIKYTGARGEGPGDRVYLPRKILNAPIKATYQVFLCRAYS